MNPDDVFKLLYRTDILEKKMADVWPPQEPDDSSDDTRSGVLFAVNLAEDGGADGSQTAEPTYTYTVTSLDGEQLATTAAPSAGRDTGSFSAATLGVGYKDTAQTFHLLLAFESPNTAACPSTG